MSYQSQSPKASNPMKMKVAAGASCSNENQNKRANKDGWIRQHLPDPLPVWLVTGEMHPAQLDIQYSFSYVSFIECIHLEGFFKKSSKILTYMEAIKPGLMADILKG